MKISVNNYEISDQLPLFSSLPLVPKQNSEKLKGITMSEVSQTIASQCVEKWKKQTDRHVRTRETTYLGSFCRHFCSLETWSFVLTEGGRRREQLETERTLNGDSETLALARVCTISDRRIKTNQLPPRFYISIQHYFNIKKLSY